MRLCSSMMGLISTTSRESMASESALFDAYAFRGVEIARAVDDDVGRLGFGSEAEEIDEFGCAVAHDGGERHAVDVAGGRGLGRIHIAVGVKPEVADLLFVLAEMGGNTCRDTYRDGMIAYKNEREIAFRKGLVDGGSDVLAGFGDFLKVFGALFPKVHFFGLLDFEVADVFHGVAELLNARLESRAAKGGRAHVNAAATLSEVHGNADDANFLGHNYARFVRLSVAFADRHHSAMR